MFSVAYTNKINIFLSYNNYTEALYYIVIHLGYGGVRVRVFRRKVVALEVYLRHRHPSSVPPVVCVLCVCACMRVCMC